MDEGPSNITNPTKSWKREQVLWAAVAVFGLLVLLLWFLLLQKPHSAPPPSPSAVGGTVTETATPSPSVTVSSLPTLEEVPYESTQSDAGFNPAEFEQTLESTSEPTETPTFYMAYVTSTRTPIPRSSGGGGGGGSGGGGGGGGFFYASWTPNKTSTAYAVNNTRTATFLYPTRQTATYVYGQTATIAIQQTNIARTPRPQQIAYSQGGSILLMDTTTTPSPTPKSGVNTPTPGPTAWAIPGNMGDWAPDGLRIVFENAGRLYLQWLNPNGTLRAAPSNFVTVEPPTSTGAVLLRNQPDGSNTQPAWSPNRTWIVFRNDGNGNSANAGLYRMDQTGAVVQRLTTNPDDQMPDWNSDGSQIVFVSGGNIFLLPVSPWPPSLSPTATGVPPTNTPVPTPIASRTQITRTTALESWPHFSPDGKFLLYQREDAPGQTNIYILDMTQQFIGEPRQLTGDGTETEPFWSRSVSYFTTIVNKITLMIQDRYGNQLPAGTQDASEKTFPRWRP